VNGTRPDTNSDIQVSFLEPQAGALLQGLAIVRGTALGGSGQPVALELSLDGQLLATLEPKAEWTYRLDTRSLAEGEHVLSARATDGDGDFKEESLPVSTKKLELPACPEGQLLMQYFRNELLAGSPALTRCEALPIRHDWESGGPEGPADADRFSVSWSGALTMAAGAKVFRGHMDDGARLRLDGELLVDDWRSQPLKTFEVRRVLSAGPHELQVEYFEGGGAAMFELHVESVP
jgi:PA14 domain